jgi:CheY-like chemotaxis protein/DNA-binding PadR family transcriptional regulator
MSKILIVDDEAIITMQLEERLSLLGYKIAGMATSGEEAIDKAKKLKPDIVLMDIVMPGKINGIEAAKSIHGELDIPIVFVTAYADDTIIEKAKCVNPYGYIVKPFNELELKAAIEVALFRKASEQKGSARTKPDREPVPVGENAGETGGGELEFIDLPAIKIVLLDDIFNDITLFLYTDPIVKEPIFRFAIENGLKNNKHVLFAYSRSTTQKYFPKEIQQGMLVTHRIKKNDVLTLPQVLENFCGEAEAGNTASLRFIIDFSETDELKEILEVKSLVLLKQQKPVPLSGIIAFHIGRIDQNVMKLLSLGISRIIVSTGKGTSMSFAHNSFPADSLSVVPQATVDEIVKKSLEPVVLSFLEKPMSGYDIIHEIHNRYKVLVPQARIYTLLYSLQKKGYLEMKVSGKSKLYSPTARGREHIRQKLDEFRCTFQHIIGRDSK